MDEKSRRKKYDQQREELSDEGKRLWDKMMNENDDYDEMMNASMGGVIAKPRVKTVIVETDETQRLRLELKKMIQVSQSVISECERDMKHYTKQEEYFKANECKVAILCHTNLITRLERILSGGSAYDVVSVLYPMVEGLNVR